ncbi:MAG: hypothetical protein LBQ28_03705 [Prevotellaceae bacterium]|jgi:uncharacterized tellurite resistance protein B-like protein|nr:hypothetical protein [Prevotellaceae bacterium]
MNEQLKQHFLGLYQMVLADTEIHPKELELLYKIGREQGVTEQDIQAAIFVPTNAVTLTSFNDDEKIEYLYNLARMAWADGVIDNSEIECLKQSCKRLGFAEEYAADITEFLLTQAKEDKSFKDVLETIKKS